MKNENKKCFKNKMKSKTKKIQKRLKLKKLKIICDNYDSNTKCKNNITKNEIFPLENNKLISMLKITTEKIPLINISKGKIIKGKILDYRIINYFTLGSKKINYTQEFEIFGKLNEFLVKKNNLADLAIKNDIENDKSNIEFEKIYNIAENAEKINDNGQRYFNENLTSFNYDKKGK